MTEVNITTVTAEYNLFEVVISDLSDENIQKYAIEAAQSAADALASANLAEADKIQTGLDRAATGSDRVQTGLDAEQTGLDRIATGQDRLATAADRAQTGLDRIQTGLDAQATEADKVQTGLDRIATSEDRTQTGLDRIATGADRVQTGLDATATAADRVQTGLDRVATGADRTQTGLDRLATGADRAQTGLDRIATGQDKLATAADRVQTGLDKTQTQLDASATASDRAQTGLDRIATAADRVQTGLDKNQTGLDRIATGEDRTQTGLDRTQTGLDRIQTGLDRASAANSALIAQQVGTSTVLLGYTVGANTALTATDSILQAFGKTQGQINARVSGTIGTGQVGFGTAANTIGGDSSFIWDNVNKRLRINQLTDAGFRLDVNGTVRVLGALTTNLTATRIPFIGVGGVLTDTVNLTWDNATSIFTIRGNASVPSLVLDNSTISGDNTSLEFRRGGTFEASIFHNRSSGDLTISSGRSVGWGGKLILVTDTLERWRIGNTGILQANGSQTIQTTTGNLILASIGGNGSVVLSSNGTGSVLVGTVTSNASSALTIESTARGFLPPRMTLTQRNAIATPATGLIVYNTTDNRISVFNGTAWVNLATV